MSLFFLRKRFWITLGKVLLLAYFAGLALLQAPELTYDLSGSQPVAVASPADLTQLTPRWSQFVAIYGKGDFDRAFTYRSHGLDGTYFLVQGYQGTVVVRTYDKVGEDWKALDRHLGRLQPFRRMAFSRTVGAVFQDRYGITIPANAYYLARDDAPALSGWQISAAAFSLLAFGVVFFLGFIWRRLPKPQAK